MIVIPLISFVICFSLFSCYEHDEKKIKRLVEEWTYKEIDFPSVPIFTKFARDTIMGYYERDCDYKILTYVDSIGCMRCHLSFSAWKPFIELLKDTCPSCNVLFFIHPMSRKNIEYLLTKEGFDYPVCIDEHDSINKLNHFPIETIFQTFLLDKNNRVVAIGNPIQFWYVDIIGYQLFVVNTVEKWMCFLLAYGRKPRFNVFNLILQEKCEFEVAK